ncbi:MAG: hypothetical protein ACRDQZ_14850 [Mycobacteriales bacterium]
MSSSRSAGRVTTRRAAPSLCTPDEVEALDQLGQLDEAWRIIAEINSE